jgi:hypothetical protein
MTAREEILEILFFAIISPAAFLSCNPSAYEGAGASRQIHHPAEAPFLVISDDYRPSSGIFFSRPPPSPVAGTIPRRRDFPAQSFHILSKLPPRTNFDLSQSGLTTNLVLGKIIPRRYIV